MDPGLEKAKMLMAQAKRPIAILRKRILRFEEMKDPTDFRFVTFIIAGMRRIKEKKWG